MKTHFILTATVLAGLLSSCATYHLSTASLLQQFADTQKEKKVNVIIVFPFFFPGVVTGNNLRSIKCLNKYEKEVVLPVTRATGVHITKTELQKTDFSPIFKK